MSAKRKVKSLPTAGASKTAKREESAVFDSSSRILIIGCGAIGGSVAAKLLAAGYSIDILVRREEQSASLSKYGLIVNGQSTRAGKVKTRLGTEKYDLVFLATKLVDLDTLPKALKSSIKKGGLLVSLQNGNSLDRLEKKFSRQSVVGCVVGWGATMHSDYEFEITSGGDFFIGMRNNSGHDFALSCISDILSHVHPCEITNNIDGHLYAKILINSCITSLGGVCGLYLGDMLKLRLLRNLFIEIMLEGMRVAIARGLKVETVNRKLNYYDLLSGSGWFAEWKRHLLIRIIGFKYRKLKSSSLQSLERGQKTEIRELNGYIVTEGQKVGVKTPVNSRITEIVIEIEEGKRTIGIHNFKDVVFSPFHRTRPRSALNTADLKETVQ